MVRTAALFLLGGFGLMSVTGMDSKPVVQGNNQFAFDLYAKLKTEPGNVFFSPFSVSAALGMTAAGAKGDTLAEMARTLHLPEGDQSHRGFAALLHKFNPGPKAGYELSVANALWGQKGFPFQESFKDLVSKNYGGGMRDVDFKNPDDAAATINRWCEDQTKNRIKDLVSPEVLKPLTRLVLTNAIYFKGDWQHKFKKEQTKDQPFYETASQSSPVPMMRQSGEFQYAEIDGVQILELPYKNEKLSMLLLLPKEKHQLAKSVDPLLTSEGLSRVVGALQEKKGDIELPRFEFRTNYRLERKLQEMGMKLAFSNGADFSGITTSEPLMIDVVIHKAFVKTDEEGSEAAAATAVTMMRAAAPIVQRFQFRADHPFVFMIRDRETGSVLFMGRLTNPKA